MSPSEPRNHIDDIEWASYPQPADNRPDSVPRALGELATASSDAAAREAYDSFLFAVGNNHAGTYYPVVVPAIDFLAEVVASAPEPARIAALDILVDLVSSFEPQPGHEQFVRPTGEAVELRTALRQKVRGLMPLLRTVAEDEARPASARKLARDLLDALR